MSETVLVTGASGFIGSHFCDMMLSDTDASIVAVDNQPDLKESMRIQRLVKGHSCSPSRLRVVDQDLRGDISELLEGVTQVVHFAARTFVDHSFRSPMSHVQNNILGTANLLEQCRHFKPKVFVHVSCYDKDTRALTKGGFKDYSELRKGDLILSLNPTTGMLEEKEIEKIIIQDYEGDMIHFNSTRVDLLVTPNHNMFFTTKTGATHIKVDDARNVARKTTYMFLPRPKWKGIDAPVVKISDIGSVATEDLFYLSGLFIGDGFLAYQEKKKRNKSGLTRKEFVNRKDKKGRFVSGRTGIVESTTCRSWRIFFEIPEKDKSRKQLEQVLKRLNIKYSPHKGKSGEHIYFTSEKWSAFFEQFGKGAKNKNIPAWMLKYDSKYLRALLDGLVGSDGYQLKGNRIQYTTISEKLVKDVCELGFKLGFSPRFARNYNRSSYKGRIIEGEAFYVYFNNSFGSISKRCAKKTLYKGKIWCLRVKDNKNFIIERNGSLAICGNTDEVYGACDPEGKAYHEGSLLNPTNPYSATKAAAEQLVTGWSNAFGFPRIITRCENCYGSWQHRQKVLPTFIRKALDDEKLPVYGDGQHKRMWLHVFDHCEAIKFLMDKGETGIFNIGARQELTNLELAEKVLVVTGRPTDRIEFIDDSKIRPVHDRRYDINFRKLVDLGWKAKRHIDTELAKTIMWYVESEWWLR